MTMGSALNELGEPRKTAKYVVLSGQPASDFDPELHDTRKSAEDAAQEWMKDLDQELTFVAKIVTKYEGRYPERVVDRTEVH